MDEGKIMTLDAAEIAERAERLNSIAVSPETAPSLEVVRKEANAYLKAIDAKVSEARRAFMLPFEEMASALEGTLKPLREATKSFSENLLEANKARFRERVRAEWGILTSLDPDGNVAPFDEVYDPSWYRLPEKEWKPRLASAIREYVHRDEKTTAYFVLECTNGQVRDVEGFLIANKIIYRKETL